MRKVIIYSIISLFLFIPAVYGGFWYFAAWKAKKHLVKMVYNITGEEPDISCDKSGFPSNLIFHIKNPKFSDKELTISTEALLIKNRMLDRSLHIYVPSNEINIVVHGDKPKNIKCSTDSKSYFTVKLNKAPFSSQLDGNGSIIDHISAIRYRDYGLKCDFPYNSENEESITTTIETNDRANQIRINFYKRSNEGAKLGFDFSVYRFKDTVNPESYLSIDTKFNYELINDISASKLNFDIEKFLIQSNKFSLTASGGIHDYNMVTFSFRDKINIDISNYKEFVLLMLDKKSTAHEYQELISSLSEKTINDNVQFTIRYDNDMESSFIGKLPITDFFNKLTELSKDESSN